MHDDMVTIPAGEFRMGSEGYYPEEAPVFTAHVEEFLIDRHPVTNRQFRAFIDATGYVTVAEKGLDAAEFPQLSEADRAPGSLVFHETDGPVDLRNWRAWWSWGTGADWRHPFGPDSSIDGMDDHPVVQVSYTDAVAYSTWAGKRLPTEEEWERAARGHLDGADFAWGDDLTPGGELRANTWQGSFPFENTGALGWTGTSPVGTFPAGGFGLVDMIGNVWEWTSSRFTPNHREAALAASLAAPIGRSLVTTIASAGSASTDAAEGEGCGCGCGPASSRAAASGLLPEQAEPDSSVSHVTKGGSHLCAPEYCQRYRPAARSPQTEDSATTHLGFRCARSV